MNNRFLIGLVQLFVVAVLLLVGFAVFSVATASDVDGRSCGPVDCIELSTSEEAEPWGPVYSAFGGDIAMMRFIWSSSFFAQKDRNGEGDFCDALDELFGSNQRSHWMHGRSNGGDLHLFRYHGANLLAIAERDQILGCGITTFSRGVVLPY